MRKFLVICGAMLLVSIMLIAASSGATAVEEAFPAAAESEMEIIEIAEDTADAAKDTTEAVTGAAANTNTKTFGLWGLPFSWWPSKFCAWDYWTNAAWTVTLSGTGATCNDQTGRALAGLARQAVTTNRNLVRLVRGRLGTVTTSAVLCARSGANRARYTVRLSAPRATLVAFRQPTATTIMRSIFTRQSVSRTVAGATW
jgi:hypothetical protein